ncbi:MAG: hypothetical protein Q9218_005575 [Villophora microphyllina]
MSAVEVSIFQSPTTKLGEEVTWAVEFAIQWSLDKLPRMLTNALTMGKMDNMKDKKVLRWLCAVMEQLIMDNGGTIHERVSDETTHLIVALFGGAGPRSRDYKEGGPSAVKKKRPNIKTVRSEWLWDCVRKKERLDEDEYPLRRYEDEQMTLSGQRKFADRQIWQLGRSLKRPRNDDGWEFIDTDAEIPLDEHFEEPDTFLWQSPSSWSIEMFGTWKVWVSQDGLCFDATLTETILSDDSRHKNTTISTACGWSPMAANSKRGHAGAASALKGRRNFCHKVAAEEDG